MKTVVNEYDVVVDFEFCVAMMDEDIREQLHLELCPCSDQEFFDEYVKRHAMKYREEFEAAKPNPCM